MERTRTDRIQTGTTAKPQRLTVSVKLTECVEFKTHS